MGERLNSKIVAHHVGGRGFGVSFNPPPQFQSDVTHVLYEADPAAVDELRQKVDSPMARMLDEYHVMPYCMGRQRGRGKLNVTANTYASSLLAPNPDFSRYYCEIQIAPAVYDVTYDDMLEVVKEVDVEIHCLDDLLADGTIAAELAPDFLSLDTQGMERDIIEGASRAIADGVLAVITEVEVLPMYRRQPLLGDMLGLMNSYGFDFAGFTNLHHVSTFRAPIGLRGNSLPGFGDALFLRRPETLRNETESAASRHLRFAKLAFIALAYGHLESALHAIRIAREIETAHPGSKSDDLTNRKFWRFLEEFRRAAASVEALYPPIFGVPAFAQPDDRPKVPSWSDLHHDKAVARLAGLPIAESSPVPPRTLTMPASGDPSNSTPWSFIPPRWRAGLKRLLFVSLGLPPARVFALANARPVQTVAAVARRLASPTRAPAPPPASADATRIPPDQFSPVEALLNANGFGAIAELVRQRRRPAERFARSLPEKLQAEGGCTLPTRSGLDKEAGETRYFVLRPRA